MSPLINNIVITVAGIIYVFSVVAIMDLAVKKGFPNDISRKIVHIAAGSWLIFWLFYDHSHWSKYLNILPAFIWTILLLIKGLTAKPGDEAVRTMTRNGDRRELLLGPLFFTIVMNIMGTFFYNTSFAATSMGILGWGDGLAPVFGKRYGKHPYKIFAEKTFEGSVSFIIFGFLGAVLFNFLLFNTLPVREILLCTFFAALVEAFSPKDIDNLLIPASCAAVYWLFS